MTSHPVLASRKYIEQIRNDGKREYAVTYLKFIRGAALEPSREQFGVSAMAAQAVRLDLNKIWNPSPSNFYDTNGKPLYKEGSIL